MNKFIIVVACVASISVASAIVHDPAWTDFRGSYLLFQNETYAPFPTNLTHPKIDTENWELTSTNCSNGGIFQGLQYIRTVDDGVALLFDIKGTIAGIQLLIKHSVVHTPTNTLKYNNLPVYQNITHNGELYYVVTAYFVEPSTICSTGRNSSAVTAEGVWIQNGTDVIQVPDNRPESEDEAENNGWTKNECFPGMGFHNFYSIVQYENSECSEMFPVFGLYNKNTKNLLGFGLITPGNLPSPRLEHPPAAAIKAILGETRTPPCVLQMQEREKISSIHIYFTPNPLLITCPASTYIPEPVRRFWKKISG